MAEKSKRPHWTQRLKNEVQRLKEELETVKQERDEFRDLYLRTRADFENYKRAMDQRWKQAVEFASERLVSELLPVLDNFERALAVSEEADARAILDGVRMIFKQLREVLEREGLKPFSSKGEPFDPRKHEAVSMVESSEPAGIVVEEYERGYYFKERLLRPAKVVVSRGQGVETRNADEGGESS